MSFSYRNAMVIRILRMLISHPRGQENDKCFECTYIEDNNLKYTVRHNVLVSER